MGLVVRKRHADLTYRFPLNSTVIQAVENVSESIEIENPSAETYRSIFDMLLPQFGEDVHQDDSRIIFLLSAMVPETLRMTLYVLPWHMQNQTMDNTNLPAENSIDSKLCKSIYRIKLALESFYIFTTFSVSILMWCLVRGVQSSLNPIPPLSSFSDIDFAEKLNPHLKTPKIQTPATMFSRLCSLDNSEVIKTFKQTTVCVQTDFKQFHQSEYEMDVESSGNAHND